MILSNNALHEKNVVLVTDQFPFPPRNGITLPTYHYLMGLMKNCQVKLYMLIDEAEKLDSTALAQNEQLFGPIEVIRFKRKKAPLRMLREILGKEMYQHGWEVSNREVSKKEFFGDMLIVSPISAVAKWESATLRAKKKFEVSIAAVNDCTTAEYFSRHLQAFGGFKTRIKSFVDRLRYTKISRVEKKLLYKYEHIFLQTEADLHFMNKLVSSELASRVILCPNGVRADLLQICPQPAKCMVFVAELSGEYREVAQWLVKAVWPKIRQVDPSYKLLIIGKGADVKLKKLLKEAVGVTYIDYVEDLSKIYEHATVVFSPVFKGFGLINKTLEAMASSVPVVGGVAAFNGISGFKNGEHGLACKERDAKKFSDLVIKLMKDHKLRKRISTAGRALVESQFDWNTSIKKIERLF